MKQIHEGAITLFDLEPRTESFRSEVLEGLARTPKTLPCKFFYDEEGSRLFDRICDLDEYYPTRTELALMTEHVGEMVELIGPDSRLIELGSGSSLKTRILLDHARGLRAYMPIDISREHLLKTARELAESYPEIPIQPVCADYSEPIPALPEVAPGTHDVVYFPGSTIGNLERREAESFLARIGRLCGVRGGLLIGVDLKKDAGVLHRAYNDSQGVTAAFNLNLLARINRELDGTFDLRRFRHRAFYDDAPGRIEMQLVSLAEQTARVGEREFRFAAREAITTEYSHKYALDEFADLAAAAGFAVRKVWTDPDALFSVQYCER